MAAPPQPAMLAVPHPRPPHETLEESNPNVKGYYWLGDHYALADRAAQLDAPSHNAIREAYSEETGRDISRRTLHEAIFDHGLLERMPGEHIAVTGDQIEALTTEAIRLKRAGRILAEAIPVHCAIGLVGWCCDEIMKIFAERRGYLDRQHMLVPMDQVKTRLWEAWEVACTLYGREPHDQFLKLTRPTGAIIETCYQYCDALPRPLTDNEGGNRNRWTFYPKRSTVARVVELERVAAFEELLVDFDDRVTHPLFRVAAMLPIDENSWVTTSFKNYYQLSPFLSPPSPADGRISSRLTVEDVVVMDRQVRLHLEVYLRWEHNDIVMGIYPEGLTGYRRRWQLMALICLVILCEFPKLITYNAAMTSFIDLSNYYRWQGIRPDEVRVYHNAAKARCDARRLQLNNLRNTDPAAVKALEHQAALRVGQYIRHIDPNMAVDVLIQFEALTRLRHAKFKQMDRNRAPFLILHMAWGIELGISGFTYEHHTDLDEEDPQFEYELLKERARFSKPNFAQFVEAGKIRVYDFLRSSAAYRKAQAQVEAFLVQAAPNRRLTKMSWFVWRAEHDDDLLRQLQWAYTLLPRLPNEGYSTSIDTFRQGLLRVCEYNTRRSGGLTVVHWHAIRLYWRAQGDWIMSASIGGSELGRRQKELRKILNEMDENGDFQVECTTMGASAKCTLWMA